MADRSRIASLEERLASAPGSAGAPTPADLEALADLYLHADYYVPALETLDRLLSLPAAPGLSRVSRAAIESKAVACRLARGDSQAALAQCRELLRDEEELDSLPLRARLHIQMARALQDLGRIQECAGAAATALQLADACGDLALSAHALTVLGTTDYRSGNLEAAWATR